MKVARYITLITCLVLSCTNPFSGRDSEIPSEPEGTYLTPVTPQMVLVNLENSYNEKIIANFMRCFDTLFIFRYDYLLFGKHADSGWAYEAEVSLTENIFTKYRKEIDFSTLSLTLRMTGDPDQEYDTTAVLKRDYRLISVTVRDGAAPDTTTYVGTGVFSLVDTGFNLWAIREWEDLHQSSSDTSWADFKNGFR